MWCRLIRWNGIAFRLHPLFVLVMLGSVATGRFIELATLFVIVLVHELGHLAAGLHFGWTIREVKLLPFGGVVEVEEAGSTPVREEWIVAAAGPFMNVALGAAGWLLGYAGWVDGGWAAQFTAANALIFLFNLLPVLPLDGGRMLQSWFSLKLPYRRALFWSARLSLVFSGVIVLASLYPLLKGGLLQLNLLAVGLFLCAANWQYLRNAHYLFLRFLIHRARSSERKIEKGTLARPIVIGAEKPLSSVVRLLMKEKYHLVYVMRTGKIAKVVPEKTVIDGFLGALTSGHADFRFFM
jgi:stage IV sporulation protein FB